MGEGSEINSNKEERSKEHHAKEFKSSSKREQRKKNESSESSSGDSDSSYERRKKRKSKKREKRKEEKKRHKRRRKDSDESGSEEARRKKKKLLKKARNFLKKTEKTKKIVAVPSNFEFDKISEEDYFSKNQEFATWLLEARGQFFSSLSAEASRAQFLDFVKAWNAGKLSEKYYEGIKKAARTSHNWGLVVNMEEKDVDVLDEEARNAERKLEEKLHRKRARKEADEVLEELAPKATGREAVLEKKAARRAAEREKEFSPEPMGEKDIMGGGDDFQSRLARERQRKEKRTASKVNQFIEKKTAFDEKESETMDRFRALVETAGGKISIPKRMD